MSRASKETLKEFDQLMEQLRRYRYDTEQDDIRFGDMDEAHSAAAKLLDVVDRMYYGDNYGREVEVGG